jgi:protein TonB
VAYRTDISNGARGGAIVSVLAIHGLLLFALLHLSGKVDLTDPQAALRVFNLAPPVVPPPPPPPPPPEPQQQAKPKEQEGGSAPRNIKSEATEVKAPKPRVVVPPVPQIPAAETPRAGTAPTQGASPVAGPGTGAGGTGTGTGSGTGGAGSGGGGDNGVADPPHLITPVLTGRDFPRATLQRWPRGAQVFLRLRVDSRGLVSECIVDRGTGIPEIDSELCALVHQRLRFRPALNRSGQAVAGWFGYAQRAPR